MEREREKTSLVVRGGEFLKVYQEIERDRHTNEGKKRVRH